MTATGRRRQTLLLGGTLLVAIAVIGGISAWVRTADPAAGPAEAMKTGGLAGAAVVALYGRWLNDRRRRSRKPGRPWMRTGSGSTVTGSVKSAREGRDGPDPDRSGTADPDRGRLPAEELADDRER